MKQICKYPLLLITLICADAHSQVRIDSYGDTLKGNIKRITQCSLSFSNSTIVDYNIKPDTTKSIYTYDKAKDIELIRFYNERDKEISREVIRFDSKGYTLEDNSYTDLDSLYRQCTYKYDVQGRLIEKREMSYPFHASYPQDRGEVWTEFNDSLGSRIKYVYDNTGHLAEQTEEQIWDSRTTTDNIAAYRYDAKGNKTEEYTLNLRMCGAEENYFLFYVGGKGYTTKTEFKYDSLNRLAQLTEYSERKTPSLYSGNEHTGTYIGTKKVYNYSGRSKTANDITFMSLYRQADSTIATSAPSTLPNWAAHTNETMKYDKHGNVIKKKIGNQLIFERTIEYF